MQRVSRWAAAPLAMSMVLGACGGGGDDGSDDLSLEERLFQGNEADFAKQQELIRECMVAQGFEYTPRDNRGDNGPRRLDFDPASEDFVKEYGFGISTLFGSQIEVRSSDEDPNQQYRNSLSEAQQAAYDKALFGEGLGGGGFSVSSGGPVVGISPGGGSEDAKEFTPSGCFGEALKATGNDRAVTAELFDELRELDDRVKSDPKMVEAMKDWSTCMADAGYTYRDLDDAMKDIREEFAEVTGLDISSDGGALVFKVEALTSSKGATPGEDAMNPLANADKAKLAELQEREKRVAQDSYECIAEHVADVEQEVRERLEDQFLDEHPELKGE